MIGNVVGKVVASDKEMGLPVGMMISLLDVGDNVVFTETGIGTLLASEFGVPVGDSAGATDGILEGASLEACTGEVGKNVISTIVGLKLGLLIGVVLGKSLMILDGLVVRSFC